MSVTNRKAVIEQVASRFASQLVALPGVVDQIGRRLLPHCIEAMPIGERPNWGVLRKSTGTFPYDILVWKPTREHFDVWTSRAVSGDEKNDKTGPRRLIATWGEVGVLPRPDWTWCDWRDSNILPLESDAPPAPDPPLDPPPNNPDNLATEVVMLRTAVTAIENWIRRPL